MKTPPIRRPSAHCRFLVEAHGVRRYFKNPESARRAARSGVLWVPLRSGWTCEADRVAQWINTLKPS